ncbi:MAG: hypothetical protein Q8P35_02670 [Candidatus Yanofskybacteria bacterium]|nr:hypothetical protein [Candidatus Yanofskybacteria bacterium]
MIFPNFFRKGEAWMIKLSNGHCFEFVAASGALAFDGRGWPWDWPFRWMGLLDPHLFTIVTKTIMPEPWRGNLQWHFPWKVVKFLSKEGNVINPALLLARPNLLFGAANAIGLTNSGLEIWLKRDYPVIERAGYKVIVSITREKGLGCKEMARRLSGLKNVVGIEYKASCPNTDPTLLRNAELVARNCYEIKQAIDYPLLLKLSCVQPYVEIARAAQGIVEAISINSVPWSVIYPDRKSPLASLGGGGVSGKIVQQFTWKMVEELCRETGIPVIGPSIWEYKDILRLQNIGASAVHFGTIFFYPWKPTSYVKKWMK